MPTAAATGAGTAARSGAGTGPTPAQGAQVAKFLHGQGNSRDQVHAQLRRNGHSDADAAKLTGDEFDPQAPDESKTPPAKAPPTKTSHGARSGSKSSGKASSRARRVSVGPASVPVPGTPAGILLALVLYPAGLAALRGGPAGLKNWFNAKFFNKTPGSPSVSGSAWMTPNAAVAAPIDAAYAAGAAPSGAAGPGSVATAYTASGAVGPVLSYALAQVGKKYVWAGAGPNGFDCSGLTMRAYQQIGVSLPHSSTLQALMGSRVASIGNAQPGDLVFPFFPITHVAIYLGNGQVVEAANPKLGIRVTSYYGAKGGIRRIVGGATAGVVNT